MKKLRSAVVLVLFLGAGSALGCRPRAVNRVPQIGGQDAGDDSGPPVGPPPTGGSGGAGGTGGVKPDTAPGGTGGVADAAPPRDAGRDLRDAAVPDLAVERGPEETINALLALTPATCAMKLSKDFPLTDGGGDADAGTAGTAAICGLKGAIYWVADMEIACDGRSTPGKCTIPHDNDTFTHTRGGAALTPAVTPYAVIPSGLNINGLPAGTVMAVINQLNKQMVFAVFGDTSNSTIGAASYACAEKLGINPDPTAGGQKGNTVVYIAFTSNNNVPNNVENQAETATLGQTMVNKLLNDNK